jgi:hypothetical protein
MMEPSQADATAIDLLETLNCHTSGTIQEESPDQNDGYLWQRLVGVVHSRCSLLTLCSDLIIK